jgi:hypothetical protein
MVVHWKRTGGPGSTRSIFINGLGAFATGVTVLVVLIAKFKDGAWITVLLIPALIVLMLSIKRHYDRVTRATLIDTPIHTGHIGPPVVLIPLERWNVMAEKAIRFAWSLSKDVKVVHVECSDTDGLCRRWQEVVELPAKQAGLAAPELVILKSPFRFVVRPIVDYALSQQADMPDRHITVLVPELIESRWFHYVLHNNRPEAIRTLLLLGDNKRITVATVPWHMP